jgi:hypothetical protein
MPKLRIKAINCVSAATGVDGPVVNAIAALPESIPALDEIEASIRQAVRAVPGLIEAIDVARQDPDNLYLTSNPAGGLDNAVWPGNGQTCDMQAGQSVAPGLELAFQDSLNISLWDYDSASDDDLLGSIQVSADDVGQDVLRKAASPVEGSIYYVHCVVS